MPHLAPGDSAPQSMVWPGLNRGYRLQGQYPRRASPSLLGAGQVENVGGKTITGARARVIVATGLLLAMAATAGARTLSDPGVFAATIDRNVAHRFIARRELT